MNIAEFLYGPSFSDAKKKKRKKKWIQKAIKKPGSFTKKAKAAGMSAPAYARYVLSHKSRFSAETISQANLAKTLIKMARKKKKKKRK